MSLPSVAPSAVEAPHLVGVRSCEQYPRSLSKRQYAVAILQKNHALHSTLVRELCKLPASELRIVLQLLRGLVEESQTVFHPQYASYGIVDAAHGDSALLGQLLNEVYGIGVVRFHHHVYSCVDGYAQCVFLILCHAFALP